MHKYVTATRSRSGFFPVFRYASAAKKVSSKPEDYSLDEYAILVENSFSLCSLKLLVLYNPSCFDL